MYEVEQKYRIADPDAVAHRLDTLDARWGTDIRQKDQYFAHPSRDFAVTDEAFRIRQVGDANFVTYKGPKIDSTTKTRRELELPLPHGADYEKRFTELLALLGFASVAIVSKVRRPAVVQWQGGPIEVVVDQVEQVGDYVELEVQADQEGLDAARQRLVSLGRELGLEEVERRSYLELLQQ